MAQSSRPADVPGLPARRSALKLLDAVLRRGDPLEIALHGACQGLADRADRALVHAITAEVLRHLPDLDALIDGATRLPLPDDAKARMVLRIALVQVLVLGTAPHAAIATALPLVDGGPRKLVHGVFGTVTRSAPVLPDPPTLPAAVADRWAAQWGSAMVEAAARAYAIRPPVDVSLRESGRHRRMDPRNWGGVSLAPGHVRLPDGANIPDLPGFADGAWWVQDVAASCPARLLGAGEGRHVLDLWRSPRRQDDAAGGGRMARDRDRPVEKAAGAADRKPDPHRPVRRCRAGRSAPVAAGPAGRRHIARRALHRDGHLSPSILTCCTVSARVRLPSWRSCRARCSLAPPTWLKPGGVLLYATCSLEQAEGEEQITRLLAARPDFALVPAQAGELPDGMTPTSQGWLRTLPDTLATQGRRGRIFYRAPCKSNELSLNHGALRMTIPCLEGAPCVRSNPCLCTIAGRSTTCTNISPR